MTTITFGDLCFELRHSNKRRSIGITIERDGQLILVSPPEVPITTLEKIVNNKRYWIYSKLLKKESLNPPVSIKEYVPGEGFYYLGRSYRLKLVEDINNEAPLKLHQSRFELHRSHQSQGREHFINWYKLHLQPILDRQINNLTHRVGASPTSVQICDLGYIWGSCGHKGDISFHWRVAMLPQSAIAYLVTHELVHLIEPNHNHTFWDRVERILPDYEERKRWLAENGVIYDL